MARTWLLRLASFAVWALVAFAAAFWALKLLPAPPTAASVPSVAPAAVVADAAPMIRLLGSSATKVSTTPEGERKEVDTSSRFVLTGVVIGRSNTGVALIAVDGKGARPYRVGGEIADGHTLHSVASRSATVSVKATGATFTVELPTRSAERPATPASSTLPRPTG